MPLPKQKPTVNIARFGALFFGHDQYMLALAAFEDAMGELTKPRYNAGPVHVRSAIRANRAGDGRIWDLGRFRLKCTHAIPLYRAGAQHSQSPGGCHWPSVMMEPYSTYDRQAIQS
jgi:hypothetical protein